MTATHHTDEVAADAQSAEDHDCKTASPEIPDRTTASHHTDEAVVDARSAEDHGCQSAIPENLCPAVRSRFAIR